MAHAAVVIPPLYLARDGLSQVFRSEKRRLVHDGMSRLIGDGAKVLLGALAASHLLLLTQIIGADAFGLGDPSCRPMLLFQGVQAIARLASGGYLMAVRSEHLTERLAMMLALRVSEGLRVALIDTHYLVPMRPPWRFLVGIMDLDLSLPNDDAQILLFQADVLA